MTKDEFNALDGAAKVATWNRLTSTERAAVRDLSGLTPQLLDLEGWRVEVETTYGETRRFLRGAVDRLAPVSSRDSESPVDGRAFRRVHLSRGPAAL